MSAQDYITAAINAANESGLNPAVYAGLLDTESSWNPKAVNPLSGASGIAQFTQQTARNPGYGINSFDPMDPTAAISSGALYLKALQDRYGFRDGIAVWKGYGNQLGSLAAEGSIDKVLEASKKYEGYVTDNLTGGVTGAPPEQPSSSKYIWQYSASDVKTAVKNGVAGFSMGLIGFMIILGAGMALLFKAKRATT